MKKRKFSLFPKNCDKLIVFSTIILLIIGTLMIMSAEMGESAGDTGILTTTLIRQLIFIAIGLIAMCFLTHFRVLSLRFRIIDTFYWVVLALLLITRLFGQTNGAYAWIRIGSIFSFQPSEIAKVYIMIYGAKLLGQDHKDNNLKNLKTFGLRAAIYVLVILIYQHDTGSALILAGIAYLIVLIPPYKELDKTKKWLLLALFIGIILMLFVLTFGTKILEHFKDDYRIARFLASANPFAYQYDSGYHLIMGLVSFATGGWFGLGYGKSIHKYMNFPNPSTDFILPVIVEEIGVVGLLPILICYGIIFYALIRHSLNTAYIDSKMILLGTFVYFGLHFVLNVGGVTGLIPLTGVPLLLISSGGSSTVSIMMSLGICESEIVRYRKGKDTK